MIIKIQSYDGRQWLVCASRIVAVSETMPSPGTTVTIVHIEGVKEAYQNVIVTNEEALQVITKWHEYHVKLDNPAYTACRYLLNPLSDLFNR